MKHANDVFGRLGDILNPFALTQKVKLNGPCMKCKGTGLEQGPGREPCWHCDGVGFSDEPYYSCDVINEDDPRAER